jgi:hypothetical protein
MSNYSNRLELFRSLTVDSLEQQVISDIFSCLLDENYDDFVDLCQYVKTIKDSISDISIFLSENGEVHFDITLSNGQKHTRSNKEIT